MKYVFDVHVINKHFREKYTVVAKDDIEARKMAIAKDVKVCKEDYTDTYKVLYCAIEMVRRLS